MLFFSLKLDISITNGSGLYQDKQDLRSCGTDDQNETSTSFKSPDVNRQLSSQPSSYEPKKSMSVKNDEEAEESVVTSKPNKQLDEGLAVSY